jgi:hypothetical protein
VLEVGLRGPGCLPASYAPHSEKSNASAFIGVDQRKQVPVEDNKVSLSFTSSKPSSIEICLVSRLIPLLLDRAASWRETSVIVGLTD